MQSKNKKIDIFAGVYFYKDQFVFVKRVKGKHIAKTENGVEYQPFDVITKGTRVNTSQKHQDSLN